MRRREFLCALGTGFTAPWPLPARAEERAGPPTIGFLNGASAKEGGERAAAFRSGLRALGYVEGENVAIEYRWADGHYDRLPALAADLARRRVVLIATGGGSLPVRDARAASPAVPIVFVIGDDPVEAGLVGSLGRPGGNITGVTLFVRDLLPKRLGLLRELLPAAAVFGLLVNPNTPVVEAGIRDLKAPAARSAARLVVARAGAEHELDAAFAALTAERAAGFVLVSDPLFDTWRDEIVQLAARRALPAIYEWREFAAAGGLMSYGTSISESYRQAGLYAGRILRGVHPADLPVLQPTNFELVINLKTAGALGLTMPASILARADEVIE